MAIPRLLKIGNGGSELIPFAKKKFKELERFRQQQGLPHYRKTLLLTGATQALIHIYTSNWDNSITIKCNTGALIAISSPGVLYGFDYYDGSFSDLLSDLLIKDNAIYPLFDNQLVYGDGVLVDGKANYSAHETGWFSSVDQIGNIEEGSLSLLAESTDLYCVSCETAWIVASFTSNILPRLSGINDSPIIVTEPRPIDNDWNIAVGADAFRLNGTSSIDLAFTWIPNFYASYPAEDIPARPGWYYGQRHLSPYDNFNPLVEAEVWFKGVAINRQVSPSAYRYGYFECVGRIKIDRNGATDTELCDIFAYFSAAPPETYSNSTEYYQFGMTQSMDVANVTCGDSGKGIAETFRISLDPMIYDAESVIVDAVVIDGWTDDLSVSNLNAMLGVVYCVVVSGENATVYRYSGYVSTVFETSSYVGHSFSNDGLTLAIFEGTGDLIDNIVVYDTYGQREKFTTSQQYGDESQTPEYADGDSYAAAGITLLSNTPVPERFRGKCGVVIPISSDKEKTCTAANGQVAIDIYDARAMLPSMATINFTTDGSGGFSTKKIVIEDGVKAKLFIGQNDCMDNTVIVESGSSSEEYLVAKTDRLGPQNGDFSIRGTFGNDDGNISFDGVGDPWRRITISDTFSLFFTTGSNVLAAKGNSGDLIPIQCCKYADNGIDIEYDLSLPGCCPGSDNMAEIVVGTTCGQQGAIKRDIDPLSMSGDENLNEGNIYSATGGKPPYTWSITCGSINEETGKVWDISGCCGVVVVSCTDQCGNTVEMETRAPGQWVLVKSGEKLENWYYDNLITCWCIQTVIIGGKKYLIRWVNVCKYYTSGSGSDCDGIGDVCFRNLTDKDGYGVPYPDNLCTNLIDGSLQCYADSGYTASCVYLYDRFGKTIGLFGYGRYDQDVYEWQCL